jgi:hemoglobin-like flavoprotein
MFKNDIEEITVELTEVEWEVINQALAAPIRNHLIATVSEMVPDVQEQTIMNAWDSVKDKWSNSWP